MKLLHTMMRAGRMATPAAVAALWLAACTDLEVSNINTEVTLGGNVSIPVGQTDTLYLSRIIDETDRLIVDDDGAYALQSSGSLSLEVAHIDAVQVSGLTSTIATQSLVTESWPGTIDSFDFSQSARLEMQVNTDIGIPGEIKRLDRLNIDPVALTVTIRVELDNQSKLSKFERLELRNFSFDFPNSIICGEGIENFDYTEKRLTVAAKAFDSKGEICITLPVVGLEDLPGISDGILSLRNFDVTAEGNLFAVAHNVSSADLEGFRLSMTYAIPDVTVTDVYGLIDSDIRVSDKRVSLGTLPDLLTDESTQINVNEIALSLSAPNPVGIPLNVALHMSPVNSEGNKINQDVTTNISIESATSFSEPKTSNLWITNSEHLAAPDGFTRVFVPDLARLIGKVPTAIDITPSVDIVTDTQHFIRLGEYYSSAVDYTVCIPFNFGPGSHLVYRETIDNLADDLSDITDKIKDTDIEVAADIFSTVPMALTLGVTPYDTAGRDMSADLDFTSSLTVEPGSDTPAAQQRSIVLREITSGALSRLDRLELTVEGDTRQATGILRPTQYVVVKMSARLPNGITIEGN